MAFSEILTQRRKALRMSQEVLAEKIQVSRQAVSKWETGESMPDMAKLIALADALEMSIDDLCGRSTPSQMSYAADAPVNRSRKRLIPALCAVLIILLLFPTVLLLLNASELSSPASPPLPDTVTVSGVMFHNNGEGSLYYCFTPSVVGEEYTYEITFSNKDGISQTFAAPCTGGVCADTVVLQNHHRIFNVSVVVSNGEESRAVPAAINLNLSFGSGASWLPVE